MKKKIFAVAVISMFVGLSPLFARTGIGLQVGTAAGFGGVDAAITFKTNKSPLVFAVTGNFGTDWIYVGATGDWWFQNPTISGPFAWYYGIGAAAGVGIGSNFNVGLGPRALVGLNVFFAKNVGEVYLQAAWQPMFWIGTDPGINLIHFPINLGFRIWF